MQMSIDFFAPLARRTDPVTSVKAAERTSQFKAKHEATIYAAICEAGPEGATYREIAQMTGMEPVAVARRLSAMEGRMLITRNCNEFKDPAKVRDGCAVWFRRVE